MLRITVAELELAARYEEDRAPESVSAFRRLLPLDSGGASETEILFTYGQTCFASKAGQLAGNHLATAVEGREHLEEIGRRVVWEGAQPIRFVED